MDTESSCNTMSSSVCLVRIRRSGDDIIAFPVYNNSDEKHGYHVLVSSDIEPFLQDGVVCHALLVGDRACIIRKPDYDAEDDSFNPVYVVDFSDSGEEVLCVRPVDNRVYWMSVSKLRDDIERVKSILSEHAVYRVKGT